MVGFASRLTTEQKRTLAANNSLIDDLPSADSQPFSSYHNPKTGKVFSRLPADPWSVMHYRKRGLRLGLPESTGQQETPQSATAPTDRAESAILEMLKGMAEEIATLKAKLGEPVVEEEEKPSGPVQLRMFAGG